MKNLSKILTGGALIYGAIAFVLWVLLVRAEEGSEGTYIDLLMYMTYLVLVASVLITLVLSIKNIVSDPKKIKYLGEYVVGFGIVFVLSYVLANGNMTKVGELTITESASRWVGTGLYAFYILTVVTFGSIIYAGVKGLFSK